MVAPIGKRCNAADADPGLNPKGRLALGALPRCRSFAGMHPAALPPPRIASQRQPARGTIPAEMGSRGSPHELPVLQTVPHSQGGNSVSADQSAHQFAAQSVHPADLAVFIVTTTLCALGALMLPLAG